MDTTEEQPQALISVTDDTIPLLNLEGKLIRFKADPLADQAWAELVGLGPKLKDVQQDNAEAVTQVVADLKRILGEFVVDGKPDWNKSKTLGLINLTKVMNAYVEAVTDGIPT